MYPRIQRELVVDPLAFREHISGPLVWSIAGIILMGEDRSTLGEICPSATLSTTTLTWTDRGSNPCIRGERPATNFLIQSAAQLENRI